MDLIIDLGNTNKKLALFEKGELSELVEFSDLHLEDLRSFVESHPGIERCILSSVIEFSRSLSDFLREKFFFIELDEGTPVPVINRYKTPETLGKDRLAAAVAATSLFPGEDVLVINMGSCITYEFVNNRNEYLGGAISPGMNMRFKGLNTFTGKLPLISYREKIEFPGRDTETAILSGVVNGIVHEIEGTVEVFLVNCPGLRVILSGGDLGYFEKRLKISIFAVPNIVLKGLYQILAFNVNHSA
jgi:type III pantothenate kinase